MDHCRRKAHRRDVQAVLQTPDRRRPLWPPVADAPPIPARAPRLDVLRIDLRIRAGRIEQHGDGPIVRRDFPQQSQPLREHHAGEHRHAGHVAARTIEVSTRPVSPDRLRPQTRSGSSPSRPSPPGLVRDWRWRYYFDLAADQIARQRRADGRAGLPPSGNPSLMFDPRRIRLHASHCEARPYRLSQPPAPRNDKNPMTGSTCSGWRAGCERLRHHTADNTDASPPPQSPPPGLRSGNR